MEFPCPFSFPSSAQRLERHGAIVTHGGYFKRSGRRDAFRAVNSTVGGVELMATTRDDGPVIAIVGAGQALIATLINTIVDVAHRSSVEDPPTKLLMVDSRGQPGPRGDPPYPLGGRSPADLHPFDDDKPLTGFLTFGQYVVQQLSKDPSLSTASTAPTYRQIDDYLFTQLELALITFAAQVTLEGNHGRTFREVEQATPDGRAIIHFVDGTSLSVAQVIRAKQPPHLGGVSARGDGPVIAVLGAGQAGIATLINTVVDVAYRTPDGASPTKIVVIDTKDQPKPRGDTPYPLGGRSPADLHPFNGDTPPAGFPTFGQYVEQQLSDDPILRTTSTAPTYHEINAFLDYELELAVISFADQVTLDVNHGTVREVEQVKPDDPAVIHFVDGTSLSVAQVIRAKQPPHLGGVSSSDDAKC